MIEAKRITVGDTATPLCDPCQSGQRLRIRNGGESAIDIGGESVSAGEGYAIAVGGEFGIGLASRERLFAISADGQSNDVHVLVQRQG